VAATGPADTLARFRGDALSALAQLANWQFLAQGRTAADAWVATPDSSPVLHLWSFSALAQLLVVLPLLVLVLVETSIHRRVAVAGWMVALAALSAVAAAVVGNSPGAYFGTWTHASAFLLGSALACVIYDRRVTHALATHTTIRFWLGLAGPLGLAALVAAWVTVQPSSGWLWRGGWAGLGAVSGVVLVSALVPGSVLHHVLGVRPLQLVGRFSYGLFLFHWPAMVVLTEARVGVAGTGLLAVQLAATVVATAASWWLLETRVLDGRRLLGVPPLTFSLGLALVVVVGIVAVTA
jgi:peptidoglycan/LPS O-acetylase OafA/YrhL